MTMEGETVSEEESTEDSLTPNTSIVSQCIYRNDLERLLKSFDEDTDPHRDTIMVAINERDFEGKSPLDLAASYGRVDICRELLKRGADLTSVTEKGYSPLHHAAAWGRIGILKVLVEHNVNLQQRNAHGERARETAARYNQTECVDFLDWAEAKVNLVEYIKQCQETLADLAVGKVSKEERNAIAAACKEKAEWLEVTQDPTTQDFISKRLALEEIFAPIMLKLLEQAPHEKK